MRNFRVLPLEAEGLRTEGRASQQPLHQGGAQPASAAACPLPLAPQSEPGDPEHHQPMWPWADPTPALPVLLLGAAL